MTNKTFSRPTSAYFLILGSVTALSALGLIMVLSASSVKALNESGNSFAIVFRQAIFLAVAIAFAWFSMKLKLHLWISVARVALVISTILLLLPQLPNIGKTVGGNTNWIEIAGFTMQPSEFSKLLLILWCALRLRTHDRKIENGESSNVLLLLGGGFIIVMVLILAGDDLGTGAVVTAIFVGILFIAGISMRFFAFLTIVLAIIFTILIFSSSNRMNRFSAFFDPFAEENYKGAGWQQAHSIMGLASGGAFGSGLGASKQKWGSLPEAHTDFIFSVIGEELGLLGTLAVLFLFGLLIMGIFRVALRATSPFERYLCAGVGCWIAAQVILNVGTVVSLMPVVGVTLPFISYGGSSLLANYLAIGIVLGVLRRDPEVSREIQERKSLRAARG